jgi:hypothetical protein
MRCWFLAIVLNNRYDLPPSQCGVSTKSSRTSNRIRIGLQFEFVRTVIFDINSNRIESGKSSIRFDSCGAVSVRVSRICWWGACLTNEWSILTKAIANSIYKTIVEPSTMSTLSAGSSWMQSSLCCTSKIDTSQLLLLNDVLWRHSDLHVALRACFLT